MHLAGTSLISAATYYLPISTNQAATKTVSTVNLLMSLPSEALRAGRCPVGHSHHLESILLELRSRLSAVDCGVSHNNITPPLTLPPTQPLHWLMRRSLKSLAILSSFSIFRLCFVPVTVPLTESTPAHFISMGSSRSYATAEVRHKETPNVILAHHAGVHDNCLAYVDVPSAKILTR